jgi:hypothetical protein
MIASLSVVVSAGAIAPVYVINHIKMDDTSLNPFFPGKMPKTIFR